MYVTDSACRWNGAATDRLSPRRPSAKSYTRALKYERSTSEPPSGEKAPSVTHGTSPTRRKVFGAPVVSSVGPS